MLSLIFLEKTRILNNCRQMWIKLFKQAFVPMKVLETVARNDVLLVLQFLCPLSFKIRTFLRNCFDNYTVYLNSFDNPKNSLFSSISKDVTSHKVGSHLYYKLMHFYARASKHGRITPWAGKVFKTNKKVVFLIKYYLRVMQLILIFFWQF